MSDSMRSQLLMMVALAAESFEGDDGAVALLDEKLGEVLAMMTDLLERVTMHTQLAVAAVGSAGGNAPLAATQMVAQAASARAQAEKLGSALMLARSLTDPVAGNLNEAAQQARFYLASL